MNTEPIIRITSTNSIWVEKVANSNIDVSIKNIDLVVMVSKGGSVFEELFIDSNAEKVVRLSKIPVLVIKKKEFKTQHFVFVSNFQKKQNCLLKKC